MPHFGDGHLVNVSVGIMEACAAFFTYEKPDNSMDQIFDHIVSFGAHCRTAHQIRRRFPDSEAHLFDWWVTPTRALVELLEEGFENIFIPSKMKIVDEPTGPAVMCGHYGTMHYHDFYNAKIGGRYSPLLVRNECSNNLSKASHLARRLLSLSGKVLFIRLDTGNVRHYDHNGDFDEALMQRFIKAMDILLPDLDFTFLMLNSTVADPGDKRIVLETLEKYGNTTWEGSDQGWDELFDRLEIRHNPPAKEESADGAGVSLP